MLCIAPICTRETTYKIVTTCSMHYKRWHRHKSFDYSPNFTHLKDGGLNNLGYKRITRNKKRVLEHRYIMERLIGRFLTSDEKVHHKNGIRNDNRPENLELFNNQSEHIHHRHPEIKKIFIDWTVIKIPPKTTRWHPQKIKNCLVPFCENSAKRRGLCFKHYEAFLRHLH